MSKFYLPSSTTISTTSQSPITSPSSVPAGGPTLSNLRQLPTQAREASYFPPVSAKRPPHLNTTDLSTPASYAAEDEDDEDLSEDDLPYPLPLARDPFHAPDFDAATYLSTLRNRHQTLEDLRTELRTRAKDLGAELFDLVNNEYEDLMGVGAMLSGGEERVEGVRVGVLGFRREIEGLRAAVEGRKVEVGEALAERRKVRSEIVLARRLLEVGERVAELERRLAVAGAEPEEGFDDDENDDDGEDGEDGNDGEADGLRRLRANTALWTQLKERLELAGKHPFFDAQAGRLKAIREALLLDLGAALRSARKDENRDVLLKLIGLYRDIGEAQEAIKVLKH